MKAGVHVGRCIAHPFLTTATKVDPMIGNGCCSVHVMRLYVRGYGCHPLGCLGSLWVQRLPPEVFDHPLIPITVPLRDIDVIVVELAYQS